METGPQQRVIRSALKGALVAIIFGYIGLSIYYEAQTNADTRYLRAHEQHLEKVYERILP